MLVGQVGKIGQLRRSQYFSVIYRKKMCCPTRITESDGSDGAEPLCRKRPMCPTEIKVVGQMKMDISTCKSSCLVGCPTYPTCPTLASRFVQVMR